MKLAKRGAVAFVFLVVIAAWGRTAAPTSAPTPTPVDVAAVITARPTATTTPVPATPASTPTPAITATPEPTPAPASAPPTQTPEPVVAVISFAHNTSGLTLINPASTFSLGENIAWQLTLPAAQGTRSGEILVIDVATGRTVASGTFSTSPGSSLYHGQQSDIVSTPGTYLMQYFVEGILVGEGHFNVAAATATQDPRADCDPSYPTVCIAPAPPDLDCKDVPFSDFEVTGDDPHNFDGDFDGIGCESWDGGGGGGPKPTKKPSHGGGGGGGSNCDPSYPTLCLRSSPDLDCGDISARNFPVVGRDPHGFDGDNDGIGCET